MIKVTDNHTARLARVSAAPVAAAIGTALVEGAEALVASAQFSIKDGAISGAGHVPSLPGMAPNADTHVLDESIHATEVVEVGNTIQTAAVADAEYAAHLELGTSRIDERPFMRPAAVRERPETVGRVAAAYRELLGQ